VQRVPGRSCFITKPQLLHRSQFLDQLPYRLLPIRNHTQQPHFSILLGDRCRNRLGMDIQPNKPYPFDRPAAFACGSVLHIFRFGDSPRAENRSRSFHSG
jgi:hypothetical protein